MALGDDCLSRGSANSLQYNLRSLNLLIGRHHSNEEIVEMHDEACSKIMCRYIDRHSDCCLKRKKKYVKHDDRAKSTYHRTKKKLFNLTNGVNVYEPFCRNVRGKRECILFARV